MFYIHINIKTVFAIYIIHILQNILTKGKKCMLSVTSLFSGIGGIDLGLEMTGHFKTKLFSEIDPFCQKVLKKHWPDVPIIPDVRDVDGTKYQTDVLVGGFPCQPFSVAGKRKGKDDQRHLWPEMFRVIKEAKPSIVIGENVQGIINTQMALGSCVVDLESEGYKVQPVVLPACSVNAPHRRYRVFILAVANTKSFSRNDRENRNYSKEKQEERNVRGQSGNVANTNSKRGCLWEANRQDAEDARQSPRGEKTFGWWDIEPNVGRVAHGIPSRVDRLKSLGNAVVPQLAYVIGQQIITAIREDNVANTNSTSTEYTLQTRR